jgi:hypothetical protein
MRWILKIKENKMLYKHTTREGQTMLVCEMETSHILNTCLLGARNAMTIVSQVGIVHTKKDIYAAHLYGRKNTREVSPQEAAAHVSQVLYALYPYLAELYFRQSELGGELAPKNEELLQLLAQLTPRNGSNGLQLPAGESAPDDEEDCIF